MHESRDFSEVVSEIVIDPELTEGLYHLEKHEKIVVVFAFDQNIGKGFKLHLHPKGIESNPEVGVFASHSPFRPNPIGIDPVALLKIEGNVLTVKGLEAFDGTPLLDIKPYNWPSR
ncbi:MAG: S-adenosyl-L-methionine-binding protein [Methanomassiliicoccales archaeon PtaU1.Bin124]|nr:MAG: S-adenosyl-L-methionine-binding protein [Methanomassiliicoccales archaeon PtaU1.Bin124]